MLSRWPIKYKLAVDAALLVMILALLAASGFRGAYAYRGLARSVSRRAAELPIAGDLQRDVSELRVTLIRSSLLRHPSEGLLEAPIHARMLPEVFRSQFFKVRDTLARYEDRLESVDPADLAIGDREQERAAVARIKATLVRIEQLNQNDEWMLDEIRVDQIDQELDTLGQQTSDLPSYLQQRMHDFAGQVRTRYRAWIVLTWVCSGLAVLTLIVLGRSFFVWILDPLRTLIQGSKKVAAGDYDHRTYLRSRDEMADLAGALNAMTQNFQEIRDDLNGQVRQRTREIVRSERLASVGFLAAGVAHEINNPLASIAICAESLQERVQEIFQRDDALSDDQHDPEVTILRDYLRMIQDEAFRCKQITERLLDFSRMGDLEKHDTDLVQLVRDVIEIVSHVGSYKQKKIEFATDDVVLAPVNPQEIKQVVLNLLTNSLDSLDAGGTVWVELRSRGESVELIVRDDGCGMTEETRKHIFEPFFTRRRDGSGTGLGLSITYRIVADHGGQIEGESDGPGRGSRFSVTLPAIDDATVANGRFQAA